MDQLLVPAAAYLRMSTGRQECSLLLQKAAIDDYARRHNFEVVSTYTDGAKSGLDLRRRPELVRLLDDVLVGRATFRTILVYDVSRWGRFQDCDEAAHYEFLCKRAGVPVKYCAESFSNEDSLSNSVMKALKRTMAAEYSRELGKRVHASSKRLAELGFKQGGAAGFALDRLLISAEGKPKGILRRGEIKNIRTDRVLLVPGKSEEVEIVREIYRLLLEEKKSLREIVRDLTARKVPLHSGKWCLSLVRKILTDPKYAGYNVWNRSTGRLGSKRVSNRKPAWTLRPGAFEPVIAPSLYQQAQAALSPYSDGELLALLRRVREEKGTLTRRIIAEYDGMPSEHTFINHFGSVRKAFQLAGRTYREPTAQQAANAKLLRGLLLKQLTTQFPSELHVLSTDNGTERLIVDGRSVGVAVCPCLRSVKHLNWYVDPTWVRGTSLMLLARLELDGSHFRDYLVLRTRGFRWLRRIQEMGAHMRFIDISEFSSRLHELLTNEVTEVSSGRKETR